MNAAYKQTEIGLIPIDWEIKKLSEIGEQITGLTYNPTNVKDYGTLVLRSSNVQNGKLSFEDNVYVGMKLPERVIVRENDILICVRNGSRQLIGKCALIDKQTAGYAFGAFMSVFRSKISSFVFYQFQSHTIQKQINKTLGATINQITNKDLASFQIPIPPTKAEQTAIATALNDTDALITALEKLIEKKRMIRQGVMQELLTGKKRLPGFSEPWLLKAIEEIGEISGAGIDKKINLDEIPIRLVNYMDVFNKDYIYSNELSHWVTAPITQIERCRVKRGDVFFTPSSEMRWDIALSAVAMEDIPDAGYSYHVVRLRLYPDWDLTFKTYIFKTQNFLNQAETICEGSGKRYVISLSKFRKMYVYYPPDRNEQSAISKILFDIDSEINNLIQKLTKYRLIKKGMMQSLLTGKKRLI